MHLMTIIRVFYQKVSSINFLSKISRFIFLVNCARSSYEQNLDAFQFNGNIFFRTTRDIQPGEELLVRYGEYFEKTLGFEFGKRINQKKFFNNNSFGLYECTS